MACTAHTRPDFAHTQWRRTRASKLRPIGPMAVFRLWVSMRIRCWRSLRGERPWRRAEDVWMDLALAVESALVDGPGQVGMSIDRNQCFDRVSQRIAFNLGERQGKHPRVLQPLRGMHRSLRRRFGMAGHVGTSLAASSGITQGCI